MSTQATTYLSQDILDRLHDDPALGSGNVLHVAVRENPNLDENLIWLDKEIELFGEKHISFSLRSLKRIVDQYAAWYNEQGVGPKAPVAIYLDNNFKNFIHYNALTGLGAVPILINGNLKPEINGLFLDKVEPVGLVTDPSHFDAMQPHLQNRRHAIRFVVADSQIKAPTKPLPAWYPFQHTPNDPTLVCHSSGTTGIPKGVINHHHQYFVGPRSRLKVPMTSPQRVLSAFPHTHSVGVSYLLRSVLLGLPTMVVSDVTPDNVLRNIEKFRATTVGAFSAVYAKLSKADLGRYDLSTVAHWGNTGDSAHEAHVSKLIRVGSRLVGGKRVEGSVFMDTLGSSELGYSMFHKEQSVGNEKYDRCIGKPYGFVKAAILDDNDNELGPNQIGSIVLKSPSITPGYWNDSVLTYRFQRRGYFFVGDVGYYDEEGWFYHLDRAVDVIHSSKGPVYTLRIEEKVQLEFDDAMDASVMGFDAGDGGSAPVAFVWPVEGKTLDAATILKTLNDKYRTPTRDHFLSAVVVVPIEQIPVGTTGKILKRQVRETYKTVLTDASSRQKLPGNIAVAV